jgi:hypothetical protein
MGMPDLNTVARRFQELNRMKTTARDRLLVLKLKQLLSGQERGHKSRVQYPGAIFEEIYTPRQTI